MFISSRARIQIDRVISKVPVIATGVNLIDIFQKAHLRTKSADEIKNNPYYSYLSEKSYKRCLVLLIPVIGQIAVFLYDRFKAPEIALPLNAQQAGVAPKTPNIAVPVVGPMEEPNEVPDAVAANHPVPVVGLNGYPEDKNELQEFMVKELQVAESSWDFFRKHEAQIEKMRKDQECYGILFALLKVNPDMLSKMIDPVSNRGFYHELIKNHPRAVLHPPLGYIEGTPLLDCYKAYLHQFPERNFWTAHLADLPLGGRAGLSSYRQLFALWKLDVEAKRVLNADESVKYLNQRLVNTPMTLEQLTADLEAMQSFWDSKLMENGPKLNLLFTLLKNDKCFFEPLDVLKPGTWENPEPIYVFPGEPEAQNMLESLKRDPYVISIPDSLLANRDFMLQAQQVLHREKFAYFLTRSPLLKTDAIWEFIEKNPKILLTSLPLMLNTVELMKKGLAITPLAWAKSFRIAGTPMGDAIDQMLDKPEFRWDEYRALIQLGD